MAPVENGNVIVITEPAHAGYKTITITWSQSWSTRHADYYVVPAKDKTQGGEDVVLFIAAEYLNPDHLEKGATAVSDKLELTVDGRFQYGQKNSAGEQRFLVYHDKERKIYQHRFVEGIAGKLAGVGQVVASFFGYGGVLSEGVTILNNAFGDYLHDF